MTFSWYTNQKLFFHTRYKHDDFESFKPETKLLAQVIKKLRRILKLVRCSGRTDSARTLKGQAAETAFECTATFLKLAQRRRALLCEYLASEFGLQKIVLQKKKILS